MRRTLLAVLPLIFAAAAPASAGTFVVTNTNDDGFGSLRNAIILANANLGPDEIEFALPPMSVIQPLTPLPTITNAVAIGVTRIADLRIFGGLLPPGSRGLHVTGHDVYIEGVILYGFPDDALHDGGEGIVLDGGADGAVVACTIFNVSGAAIRIVDSSSNYLGSNILGSAEVGVSIEGESDSNTLYGNSIGAGPGVGGNASHGVAILSGEDNYLGNRGGVCTICVSNVISSNSGSGVYIGAGAEGTRIDGYNDIFSNVGHGVEIQGGQGSQIGGGIHDNNAAGVLVGSGLGNTIRASIARHTGLGIDLAPAGVTANDFGDVDTGPNGLQNFPVLTQIVTSPGAMVSLIGMLQSASNSPYVIDFYSSEACDDSGNGEGEFYFGSANVVTDAFGQVAFQADFGPGTNLRGPTITATATDAAGNTSEFSPCFQVALPAITQIVPDSGPDTGGTALDILGQNFDNGATVHIGGVASPAVLQSSNEIESFSPMLPPGTLNDVQVTNPNGQFDLLPEAWFSDFLDVQESHLFHDFVEVIFRAKVTAGCGFGNYCPDQAVPREQMAVFLLRSNFGPTYVPPPATGTVFPNDVPADGFAASYIEALNALGITAGCAPGSFCPADPVTRAQMSVFLLRTLEGMSYNPPPETGMVFTDVPLGSFAAAWIEEIHERGITAGCSPTEFCPNDSTTRGQMAVFLAVTFGLGA
jgi:hypothetical protein